VSLIGREQFDDAIIVEVARQSRIQIAVEPIFG
jgi:hypothetical protein